MNSVNIAALVLRLVVGGTMIAHGWNHAFGGGKLPGTARWFESIGIRPGRVHALAATVTELGAGALLVLGLLTPLAAAAVVGTMVVALVANHARNGFFIFRPGEGYEYVLMITLVSCAIGALGAGGWSVDHAVAFAVHGWAGLAIAALAGAGGATLLLATSWRPGPHPSSAAPSAASAPSPTSAPLPGIGRVNRRWPVLGPGPERYCIVISGATHGTNGTNMTHNPNPGRADQTPALPTPGSANGTRPMSTLLAARNRARMDMDAVVRTAGDPHDGQRVADMGVAERPVDTDAAERAASDFLTALGIDLDREDRRATPARMARAYAELFAAQPFRLTTFPNDEGYDELVLARAIPFRTVCEHHMLLFSGVAHVGYLPGERILGLSKLARLVEHFAAGPQTQERLTMQVARCLEANLRPRGVGVVLEAEHSCMTQRGVRALGSTTVTSALLGTLRTDSRSRAEFFALARVPVSPGPI